MEAGRVKFFNAQAGKRFGFLITDEGIEVFFHYSDGRFIKEGTSEPEFGKHAIRINGNKTHLADPQKGDVIVFERVPGWKGPKASPWGYESQWNARQQMIDNRIVVYRVLKLMTSIGDEPGKPQVLWEGSNLDDALRKFPPPQRGQSVSSDPLLPYWSDSDNIFEVRHWWEKKQGGGDWQRCDDPRNLPGVLRSFERMHQR